MFHVNMVYSSAFGPSFGWFGGKYWQLHPTWSIYWAWIKMGYTKLTDFSWMIAVVSSLNMTNNLMYIIYNLDIWINLDDVGVLPLWWNCQYEKCVQNLCHSIVLVGQWDSQFMDDDIPKILG
jgi:hypothetical protein